MEFNEFLNKTARKSQFLGWMAIILCILLCLFEEKYIKKSDWRDLTSIIAGNLGGAGLFLVFVLKLKQISEELKEEREQRDSLLNSENDFEMNVINKVFKIQINLFL